MHKILFICHGNICRSPMAEFLLKDIVKNAALPLILKLLRQRQAGKKSVIPYITARATSWRSLVSASQASMQYR